MGKGTKPDKVKKSSLFSRMKTWQKVLGIILGIGFLGAIFTDDEALNDSFEAGQRAAQETLLVLSYSVENKDISEKGVGYDFILADIIVEGDYNEFNQENIDKILNKALEDMQEESPDGITIFAYDRKEDIGRGYTVGRVEWWPKGHTFDSSNKSNIENKSTYETTIDINEKDYTNRPSEGDYKVYDMTNELMAQGIEPDSEIWKQVSSEIGITPEEAEKIYLKVITF